jgi:hypothetical protein
MNTDPQLRRISDVLLHDWDPIGISDTVVVRDEYDRYASEIARMLARNATAAELATYLLTVEGESLGLQPQSERAQAVAEKLKSMS